MKKNWMQMTTLVLCAVLLLTVLVQGKQISELERRIGREYSMLSDRVDSINGNIYRSMQSLLEEQAKVVESYALENVSIDAEERLFVADLTAVLKSWSRDTSITLTTAVGEDTYNTPMAGDGSGNFTAEIRLPLEGNDEIRFSLTMESAQQTVREELGSYGEIAQLLPIRVDSWGGSRPELTAANQIDFGGGMSVGFEEEGSYDLVEKAEFRIYREGTVISTVKAKGLSDRSGYAMNTEEDYESGTVKEFLYDAALKDRFQLSFCCTDVYGLSYEFGLGAWTITTNGIEEYSPLAEWPILSWEE